MKLYVRTYNYMGEHYYVDAIEHWGEIDIAKKLNISIEKYQKILKHNGALYKDQFSITYPYYFKSKKDAEEALKELEPYLIMVKLTE